MNKEKFLIVGSGGRESSFALNLMQDSILYAVIDHENPTIIDAAEKSRGAYLVADSSNPNIVADFARKEKVDYVFVSADNPLANGVVDKLLANSIKAIGGTKEATRIEWDKVYSMRLMQKECPQNTPFFTVASNEKEIEAAIKPFTENNLAIVVKPQGLSGGKGVKIMPEHLATYKDCVDYAHQLLQERNGEQVLFVEKVIGVEFTIMGFTDGENLVLSPASYDYPFRYEGDKGPGTGGMGCFTSKNKRLPFIGDSDWNDCQTIMQKIINRMKKDGLLFNGILNGGFFKTTNGIKFMEFNGRFGDPEGINILAILNSPLSKVIKDIWHKRLSNANLDFIPKASVVTYLVAKEYPAPSPQAVDFYFDIKLAKEMGVNVLAAHTKKLEGSSNWTTLKRSRVLAVVATSTNIKDASYLVNKAIKKCLKGDLEYRKDIGESIPSL